MLIDNSEIEVVKKVRKMDLLDEVESLEAILMDDVRITRNVQSGLPEMIETTIYPLVDEETEQQYVCVTLQVIPKSGYPEISPDFKLVRPRGLDDLRLDAIRAACVSKLKDSLGFPVVFDLIEVVRELLTNSGNLPSGQCVICLYGFTEGDEFTRTECFHYLHSYCLARHLNALRRNYHEEFNKLPGWLQKTAEPFQAACPVCRETIADDTESLKCAMPPAELQNAPEFQLTDELRKLQQRMSALFLEQKNRGAIIDIEADSGSVISIENEVELRRRLPRKQVNNRRENTSVAAVSDSNNPANTASSTNTNTNTNTNILNSKTTANNQSQMQQTEKRTEQTNSNQNEQPNRRHIRGGRRHHHHHYHHNRDRERERFEQNHVSQGNNQSTNQSGASGSRAGAISTTANVSVTNAGSRQSKGHSHAR